MEFRENMNAHVFLGKEPDAEKMLHLFIYNYMKKQGFHEAAEIFAEETKIEMVELADYDENLLKDWWDVFWPQFCSRMTKQPWGNPQSSSQPSMKEALEMLAALRSPQVGISHQLPTGNPLQHMNNGVGQPPDMLQTPCRISERRAGKRPMHDTDTTSIQGHSGATARGTGPLGFRPVKLLPTEITPVPHPCNSSHLQMPVAIQPHPHVVRDPWSVQLESNYPAGGDSAYAPTAPHAGEDNWENQVSLTGVRVRAPDGPDPESFLTRVPATFLEFMRQGAEALKRHSNTPPDKF